MPSLTAIYFGNPLWSWAAAALVAAGAFCGAALLKHVLRKRLERGDDDRSGFSRAVVLQVARSTSLLLVLALRVSSAGLMLTLPDKIDRVLRTIAVAALSVQAALWIHAVIVRLTRQGEARAVGRDPGSITMIRTWGSWARPPSGRSMVLVALTNAGINISALVAGLGIGGIAVALALQNILADVFASVSIILDKPYQVGDFIVVGDSMGTVERIGIKTTRVRSLGGEELVFANGELLKSRIRNFRRMSERRIEFIIGVPFDTPHHKVERIPPLLGRSSAATSWCAWSGLISRSSASSP
jgi:small-conductance mechanosensitive channel